MNPPVLYDSMNCTDLHSYLQRIHYREHPCCLSWSLEEDSTSLLFPFRFDEFDTLACVSRIFVFASLFFPESYAPLFKRIVWSWIYYWICFCILILFSL